jgi:heme/copper-type cytochrome/quinol oxidase subunit 2
VPCHWASRALRVSALGLALGALAVTVPGCSEAPAAPLTVTATGRDFYWHFTYHGADGALGTADDLIVERQLRLPQGRPVQLRVTSADYIYSFRSRAYGINEMAVPELTASVALEAQSLGRDDLPVDPLCGFNFLHDNEAMGFIEVLEPQAFEAWRASIDATLQAAR